MGRTKWAAVAVIVTGFATGMAEATATFTIDINPLTPLTVPEGGTWRFQIISHLTEDGNLGLAGFSVDLAAGTGVALPGSLTPGPLMGPFVPLAGFANPAGFGGTGASGNLLQMGGAQNSIGNQPGGGNPDSPSGAAVEGVARGTTVLLGYGAITMPTAHGTYTISLADPMATVLTSAGSPPPYVVELADCELGSNSSLQIAVDDLPIRNVSRDPVVSYDTIQDAVDYVAAGETIDVPGGTFLDPEDPVEGSSRNFILTTTALAHWDTVQPGKLVLPDVTTIEDAPTNWGEDPYMPLAAVNSVQVTPTDAGGDLCIALLAANWTSEGPVEKIWCAGYTAVGIWQFDPVPFSEANLTFRYDDGSDFIDDPFPGETLCETWTYTEATLALAQYDEATGYWKILGRATDTEKHYAAATSVQIPADPEYVAVVQQYPGDVDLDGTVTVFDIIDTQGAFGTTPNDPGWIAGADFDADADVDIFDVITAINCFGYGLTPRCQGLAAPGGNSFELQEDTAMTAQADAEAAAACEALRRIDAMGIRDQVSAQAIERLQSVSGPAK